MVFPRVLIYSYPLRRSLIIFNFIQFMVLHFLTHSHPSSRLILYSTCFSTLTHFLFSFQFDCTNTLNDQLLENVNVVVEGEGWAVQVSLPCTSLPYSQLGSCYTLLPIPEDIMATTGKAGKDRERVNIDYYISFFFLFTYNSLTTVTSSLLLASLPSYCLPSLSHYSLASPNLLSFTPGTLSATLKFTVRDCDPATGEPDTDEGYEDDYTVSSDGETGEGSKVLREIKCIFIRVSRKIECVFIGASSLPSLEPSITREEVLKDLS